MLALFASMTIALVTGDKVALRATPERGGANQATLWKGDWLELRGERKGWLKVYDHRHERPGWIPGKLVHVVELEEAAAPSLRAIVEFLRDTPGAESLGIAYAASYLKVAPKSGIDARLLTTLGVMADRLARRSSSAPDGATPEQLEVAQSWGLRFTSVERADGVRICFDGAAFRQALVLGPSPEELAIIALGLTEPACTPELLGATERQARDEAALELLERADPTRVPGPLANRLRMRRAAIGARLAWADARRGDLVKATKVADAAVSAFARIDRSEIADEQEDEVELTALEVAASRWAAFPAAPPPKDVKLLVENGEPGETCISVEGSPKKCTHGQLWASSLRVAPKHDAAVLAVEPLPGWLELWAFRRGQDGGWMVDVLAPSTDSVDLGYVELAGWSPDGARAIVVREVKTDGVVRRTWQIVKLATLEVEKSSSMLRGLDARQWTSAEWRGRTLALR
jgi:hypothetical protein